MANYDGTSLSGRTHPAEDIDSQSKADLYDADFYTWTQREAALLKRGCFSEADILNIAEEIETLGRAEYHALRSAYRLVAMHLLKMNYQPTHRSDSWSATIVRERNNIEDVLHDNPGLRPKRSEAFVEAYAGARREAAAETKLALKTFPVDPPFTIEQVEDHGFWP